jgi:hypothetical protein
MGEPGPSQASHVDPDMQVAQRGPLADGSLAT